jgi:thiaminase/transcriptional activator TenA
MIEVVEDVVKTPHLQELAAGTLPIEKFKFQAKQNYKYLIEYTKALGVGLAKSPDFEAMQHFKAAISVVMDVEIPFYREDCRKKLGIGVEELEGTIMARNRRSYTSHELARSWEGSLAEMYASILPCNLMYGEDAKLLTKTCRLPKGNIYREWLDVYLSEQYVEHAENAIVFMNSLCEGKTEKELRRIEEIFLVSCQFERLAWDEYYAMSTWPVPGVFRDLEKNNKTR